MATPAGTPHLSQMNGLGWLTVQKERRRLDLTQRIRQRSFELTFKQSQYVRTSVHHIPSGFGIVVTLGSGAFLELRGTTAQLGPPCWAVFCRSGQPVFHRRYESEPAEWDLNYGLRPGPRRHSSLRALSLSAAASSSRAIWRSVSRSLRCVTLSAKRRQRSASDRSLARSFCMAPPRKSV
jgi:hypothetical protein